MTAGETEFGLCLPQFTTDAGLTVASALTAEADGYHVVSLFDHLRPLGGSPDRPILECLTMLTAVAAATAKVRLLPLVLRASLRPPALVASAFAALEALAPGRMVCGVGAGDRHNEAEDRSVGLPALTPAGRREAMLDLMARVRAGGSGVPIWVGGRSSTVRTIAGEYADGWNAWGASPSVVAAGAGDVGAAARGAGRPQPRLSWGGQVLLGASSDDAREQFASWSPGRSEHDVATVLYGDASAVAARLDELIDAGVQTFLLSFVGAAAGRARRSFPQDVLPLVAASSPRSEAAK